MNDIEKLLAIEEIKQLKAQYFRSVDTKDWATFKAIFAPDAHFDISEDVPDCVLVGPDSIVEGASGPLNGVVSVHHGHCPEIDVKSNTTATGIWAMEDMLRWSEASEFPNQTFHGYGHYFESYEKIGGRWRIKAMKLRRLRVDIKPG